MISPTVVKQIQMQESAASFSTLDFSGQKPSVLSAGETLPVQARSPCRQSKEVLFFHKQYS